jgi:hypothetical protein
MARGMGFILSGFSGVGAEKFGLLAARAGAVRLRESPQSLE